MLTVELPGWSAMGRLDASSGRRVMGRLVTLMASTTPHSPLCAESVCSTDSAWADSACNVEWVVSTPSAPLRLLQSGHLLPMAFPIAELPEPETQTDVLMGCRAMDVGRASEPCQMPGRPLRPAPGFSNRLLSRCSLTQRPQRLHPCFRRFGAHPLPKVRLGRLPWRILAVSPPTSGSRQGCSWAVPEPTQG